MNKAQSHFLSWIIVFALIVSISVFLYRWSLEQAKKAEEGIEQSTDPLVCSEVGISVEGICQTFNTIKMNVSNSNQVMVVGLLIRNVGLYPEDDDYVKSKTLFIDIGPGDTEKITVLKENTLSQVKIIPITKKNDKNIYCEEQSVTKEQSELKQCY